MAINPLGNEPDIDSNLNCSINEVKEDLNCDSSEGDCFAVLWPAYIDDSYECACCGKSFPAGHDSVQLGGHKPDGMHFIYRYTKNNRVGNSVNYDPYNLPPEDSEGGIFKVLVGEEADDEGYHWLNFCRNCWPKLTSKSPEEIYAEYSASEKTNEPTEGSVDSSLGADDFDDIDNSLNCSISEVKVPENFGRNTSELLDLRNIIEGELADKGYEVSIKEISRPDTATMQISFEGETGNEAVIDKAIEEIVADVAGFNGYTDMNSSASDEEIIAEATQSYQVFYEDENGNELAEPAIINVPAGLEGMELYEAINDEFAEEFPNCVWTMICDMEDNVKMDSSKKSELNSSVHDNPALKVFVDKIKQTAQQVSAVPTMEDGKTGYKIIVRGMESADVEPLAKEMGIKLAGIKPLEGGFAIIVDDVSLNNSTIDPESPDLMNDGMRYRGYFISGSDRIGYVCVSPYGAFSPGVYKTVDEAKEAIDQDMKFRFPEGEDLNSSVDTDKLYEIADRYSSSAPVSGNWDTETQHEMKAIMEELGVSEEEAKKLMINVLGFDESMLN